MLAIPAGFHLFVVFQRLGYTNWQTSVRLASLEPLRNRAGWQPTYGGFLRWFLSGIRPAHSFPRTARYLATLSLSRSHGAPNRIPQNDEKPRPAEAVGAELW